LFEGNRVLEIDSNTHIFFSHNVLKRTGVYRWTIEFESESEWPSWWFAGIHRTPSGPPNGSSLCIDNNADVLGFDTHLYKAAIAFPPQVSLFSKAKRRRVGFVYDGPTARLYVWADTRFAGWMTVAPPAQEPDRTGAGSKQGAAADGVRVVVETRGYAGRVRIAPAHGLDHRLHEHVAEGVAPGE
jgi:hypothetical protein